MMRSARLQTFWPGLKAWKVGMQVIGYCFRRG
jgi:hypothetical protein